MTTATLIQRSLWHYRRTHLGVVAGAATAAAGTASAGMTHALFGANVDAVLADASGDKATSQCQTGTMKKASKCGSVIAKEFTTCAKAGLKGKKSVTIVDADSLSASACHPTGIGSNRQLKNCNPSWEPAFFAAPSARRRQPGFSRSGWGKSRPWPHVLADIAYPWGNSHGRVLGAGW